MSETTALVQLAAQPTLSIRGPVRIADLGASHGARLRALQAHVLQEHLQVVGPPFVRYHTFGERETDVEVGVPLAREAPGEGDIKAGQLPGGAAFVTEHVGAHDQLGRVYGRLRQAMSASKRTPNGAAWEVYQWIDVVRDAGPKAWPAPAHWRTRLVQPVREPA